MSKYEGISPLLRKLDLLREGEEYTLCITKRNKIRKKKIKILKCYDNYYLVVTKNGWKESILKGDIMTEDCYIEGLDIKNRAREALSELEAKTKEDESVKIKKDQWDKLIEDGLEWLLRNPEEDLDIIKLGKSHKSELSYYLRAKLKEDIEQRGKDNGYNITIDEQSRQLVYHPGEEENKADAVIEHIVTESEIKMAKGSEVEIDEISVNEPEVLLDPTPEECQCKCGRSKGDDILIRLEGLTIKDLLRLTGEGVVFDIIVRKQVS